MPLVPRSASRRNFVRVFVSEFLIGGACAGQAVAKSMKREGALMLRAVIEDIARLPEHSVITTLEAGQQLELSAKVDTVSHAADEEKVFQKLLGEADAALIIAPETDGILANRCRLVRSANVASWNCSPKAIELCGDKLHLAQFLAERSFDTIPTRRANLAQRPADDEFPLVLKPRDGAGSTQTWTVRNAHEWMFAADKQRNAGLANNSIKQPYIVGRALSVGVNISFDGLRIDPLPVAEQHLTTDGRLRYLGGTIPANVTTAEQQSIHQIVSNACRAIPGLAGYVGFDLILDAAQRIWIVEINPRLTTSYVGYRTGFSAPIPSRWIDGAGEQPVFQFDSSIPIRLQLDAN